jgi:hypothetical protein
MKRKPRIEHFSSLINPRNQFRKLVDEDLYSLPYDERLPRLLAHRFGLWDVLAACEREGSLDSAIRKPAASVPGAGNGRLQRPGVGQVRAAVRTGRLPHRGAAVVVAGAYDDGFRAEAGRMA